MEARRARMNKLRPIPGGWRLEDSLSPGGGERRLSIWPQRKPAPNSIGEVPRIPALAEYLVHRG